MPHMQHFSNMQVKRVKLYQSLSALQSSAGEQEGQKRTAISKQFGHAVQDSCLGMHGGMSAVCIARHVTAGSIKLPKAGQAGGQ